MPYIMVIGNIHARHLSNDDGATVYGLNSEERVALIKEINTSSRMVIASSSDSERTVLVKQKGITLVVVNKLHTLFGYDVMSHAMVVTNANRELISFTMYKQSS